MTSLFVFTIADDRERPPRDRTIRTLSVIYDWDCVPEEWLRDGELVRALFLLWKAAEVEAFASGLPVLSPPLISAITECYLLGQGLYANRDGGPYAFIFDDRVVGLRGLERHMKFLKPQNWHDAHFLGRQLADLKRHLR